MNNDEIYGHERARQLIELLRSLGARIAALKSDADLLSAGPELMRMMGDARSELFHYEVRATYDTPQRAESRRIVNDALRGTEDIDFGGGYVPDDQEIDEPWRD